MTDRELGLEVLRSYYRFWNKPSITFDSFVEMIKARRPMGGEAFISGLGMGVREAEINSYRYTDAMRKLAIASGGKLPARNGDFFNYLSGVSINVNFIDAITYTATESAKDVLKGAESVGNSILTTGKILNFLLPAILLIFVFFWLNGKSNGQLLNLVKRK